MIRIEKFRVRLQGQVAEGERDGGRGAGGVRAPGGGGRRGVWDSRGREGQRFLITVTQSFSAVTSMFPATSAITFIISGSGVSARKWKE